ncbi:hypothetical protein WEU32_06760 [Brevundimonas sp. BH3]|uniref:hypothetical protein n=1 Tax=Brevundimonas sp. BH3 TaxID=3133089 RepID=UPI00324F3422
MAKIPPRLYAVVKLALIKGYFQHWIAARLGVNQGRISEFKNSPLFDLTTPATSLPDGWETN